MLVVLPRPSPRSHVYAINIDRRVGGRLLIKNRYSKILSRIPIGVAETVPVISRYRIVDLHKFATENGRYRLEYLTARELRSLLLDTFYNVLVIEERHRKPKHVFEKVHFAFNWVHKYYVITNEKIYTPGTEPSTLFVNKFFVTGPIVVMIT